MKAKKEYSLSFRAIFPLLYTKSIDPLSLRFPDEELIAVPTTCLVNDLERSEFALHLCCFNLVSAIDLQKLLFQNG